ncbi:MAG: hypothetical protein IPH63_05295 [Flavobacteriales bacterium]|nr:hypothetical protein [Flavobacteriales bacterium]
MWNTTCADCAGVPNGNSEVDACGVCYAGGASNPGNTTSADAGGPMATPKWMPAEYVMLVARATPLEHDLR